MGCTGCTVANGSTPNGCKSNGGCSSGGCNRLNTFDWLSNMDIVDTEAFKIVEVSFKNGAKKGFFRVGENQFVVTGDSVVVETGNGYDVGRVSLSGELVRLQMRKKKVEEESIILNVIRIANERDMERLEEARSQEVPTMIRARAIARTLGLDMKIGDVEYQGDKRKATFYYTADGRVDFRELIRHFAKEFRVKIEMRQIGARQESARIGGLGSCGRELCCSTWLTDFKSVSTAAARYQNLAINQSKLSGQCGRLKCCLNYELDTYLDALESFPDEGEKLHTVKGSAVLLKTDIFKGLMYYVYESENGRGKIYSLSIERVTVIQEMNKTGEKPTDLVDVAALVEQEIEEMDYEDVTGFIELPNEEKRKRRKRKPKKKKNNNQGGSNNNGQQNKKTGGDNKNQAKSTAKPTAKTNEKPKNKSQKGKPNRSGRPGGPNKRKPGSGRKPPVKDNNKNNENKQ